MLFEVGETVVYPHHGAATISEVKTRMVKGEEKLYLKLQVTQGDLTIEVPAENVDLVGVRDVIGKEGLDKVFEVLRAPFTEEPTNWSRRYKANLEKLASGDVIKVSEVVRDLWRRDQDRGLSAGEKRMLAKARQILISELALAEKTDETQGSTRPRRGAGLLVGTGAVVCDGSGSEVVKLDLVTVRLFDSKSQSLTRPRSPGRRRGRHLRLRPHRAVVPAHRPPALARSSTTHGAAGSPTAATDVTFVRNVTDIDDKILASASGRPTRRTRGVVGARLPLELEFTAGYQALGILAAHLRAARDREHRRRCRSSSRGSSSAGTPTRPTTAPATCTSTRRPGRPTAS